MEDYRLTTPQKNIWNLQKYYEGTSISNLCGAVFFQERRDCGMLRQSVLLFLENQSGMRLRFRGGEEPMQYAAEIKQSAKAEIPIREYKDMREFDCHAEEFAREPIALTGGAMYRFEVFHVGDRSGVLVLLSHLVADAWTFGLMAKQFDDGYKMLSGRMDISLLQGDYTVFIKAEQKYFSSEQYEKDRAYWNGKYAECPEKSPVKRSVHSISSVAANRIFRMLPPSLEREIEVFCREISVTPAVLFEAMVILYLFKINSENQAVTIGVPVLNRKNAEEKRIAGMFVSTMPLTVKVTEEMPVADLLKEIGRQHIEIFRHQKYPYADIIRNLREKQNFSESLYDVMVSYQNVRTDIEADTKWYSNGYSEVPLVISVDNRDSKISHTVVMDYQTEMFQEEEINYLLDRLVYILKQITENSGKRILDIGVVPEKERKRIIEQFNDTKAEYPRKKCVHELFQEQAERMPEKTVLIAIDKTLSYRELNALSSRVANALIRENVHAGDIVAFALARKSYMIAVMFGILKSGAAYLPIDKDYPKERIEYMLADSHAKVFITEENYREYVEFPDDREVCLELDSDDPCYCIYTSGSTGKPKGALIRHRNLVNFCNANKKNDYQYCMVQKGNCILSAAQVCFDLFSFEIMFSLLNGIGVVLTDEEQMNNAVKMTELIKENHVDIISSTPSRISMMLSNRDFTEALKQIKVIMIVAENFYGELYKKLREYTTAYIYNGYGPTETTMGVSFKKVTDTDITIGSPVANTQVYIVDSKCRALPIGVAGELCVAGDGVGLGYLNRPELTVEKFVENPFAMEKSGHGRILYHTGDLARWRVDGEIEYLGRMDTQVKIRGLRIELGEIEDIMGSFPGIRLAAVTDKKEETGRQYLVGYYTAEKALEEKELRQYLAGKLPKYMIPNYFVRLESMPMTPSGKTDRRNLPLPEFISREDYIPPETDMEKKLSKIWEKLLKIPQVSRTDDFFDLGGDSLLALYLVSEIADVFSVEVPVRTVMEKSVLEELAVYIEQRGQETGYMSEKILPGNKIKYPLLPQQKAVYAACMKQPDSLAYNMPAKIPLPEIINRNRLKQSIRQVAERHKILKSRIVQETDGICGMYDGDAVLLFEEYETGKENDFVRPFDLGKAPLFRVGFTKDAMLFDMHHIIADGETVDILLRDIAVAYQGESFPEQRLWYGDYAEYYYQSDFTEHRKYFVETLKCDFERIELPGIKNGKPGGESRFYPIPDEALCAAKEFAKKRNLTDTMLFAGVYGLLLSKYTGRKNVLGSVILQNRLHAATRNMMGMFVNTLPVLFERKENTADYFASVRETMLNLYRYQELPFLEIAETVGMHDKTAANTAFVYQADGEKSLMIGGESLVPEFLDTKTAKFDLMLEITPEKSGCKMRLEYDCEKYDSILMDGLAEGYIRILGQLSREKTADISVLSDQAYIRMTEGFNDTYEDYPRDKCVHELFREQAERMPEQTALVFGDKKFTYGQIDKMSNSLAHFLRKKGVGHGDVVPIIAKRSWQIPVAMLGILKAGGAYMPISPDYPQERIAYMLKEAKSRIALLYGYAGFPGIESIELGGFEFGYDTNPVENKNQPEDLCYVIFTSGSTGMPKGVSICHRNVVNYSNSNSNSNNVCWRIIKDGYRSIVSVTNIVFDIFVTETLLPFLNGLTVYFADEEEAIIQSRLSSLVEKSHAEIIQTTPTKMKNFMMDKRELEYLRYFKAIILGGEAMPVDLFRELRKYSEADIFNIYGPAETTVWSSNAQITGEDITIGKPIANTQIYIVDSDSRVLPIGVPGELCIAGDGVGKGYLNRPELTAEKFVKNPFATGKNGHGKVLYHTGDLARRRTDGAIEYLGRMDTQVKIRGLRIELGEIESVMGGFPGIRLAAVADKRDQAGRQYLVGYYTAEKELDEKKLRKYLSGKLPRYMVPNYFICLDTMPMTPSGKTDRKNLPIPDFAGCGAGYKAPVTDREKKLCGLMEKLLGLNRAGIQDDFFEAGGDSLTAIEYVAEAYDMGIRFSLQDVFDYPTVKQLCDFLDRGLSVRVCYEEEDFEKYQELLGRNIADRTYSPKKVALGNVLLTGATGFLGVHVLDSLMKEETGKLYCLARSTEKKGYQEKIRETLAYYFGGCYDAAFGERILPVEGDIEDEELWRKLPTDVQTVIHTAASVKHYGTYADFYRINCEGTKHIIQYAEKTGAKLIHISTLSVSGNGLADDFSTYRSKEEKHFSETSFYIGQPLDNVYIRSKFEAERAVYDAALSGLDARVVRVGNLTNRVSDFKFQPNYKQNAFLIRLKAMLEFGLFPDYLLPLYSEFSPVDKTAEGIVKLAQYGGKYSVFHLYSNRPIYFGRFLEIARQLGISMKVTDGEEFYSALQETLKDEKTRYIFEAFQNEMDTQGKLVYDSNIRIDGEFTLWLLEKAGFAWNETDMEYIRGYIKYFRNIGYLKV